MAKKGKATIASIKHSIEGSEQWQEDRKYFDKRKGKVWVQIDAPELTYESNTKALRPMNAGREEQDWGFMAAPDWDGKLEVTGTENYHTYMQNHRLKLSYYDLIYDRTDKRGNVYQAVRKKKAAKNTSFLQRHTFDVTPYLSKAIEYDLSNSANIVKMRQSIQSLLPDVASSFENIFSGSKVVGIAVHCQSGQLHCDVFAHDFETKEITTGKSKKKVTIQARKIGSLCHYGNGSGIVALNRHIEALGSKAVEICPETLDEVNSAIEGKATRSVERGREDDANRDIRMHQTMDKLFTTVVSTESKDRAKKEYCSHLSKLYGAGLAGPRKYRDQIKARAANELRSVADTRDELISDAQKVKSQILAEAQKIKSEAAKEKAEAAKEKAEALKMKANAELAIAESLKIKAEALKIKAEAELSKADTQKLGISYAAELVGIKRNSGESDDIYSTRIVKAYKTQAKSLSKIRELRKEVEKLLPTLSKAINSDPNVKSWMRLYRMLCEALGIDISKNNTPDKGVTK